MHCSLTNQELDACTLLSILYFWIGIQVVDWLLRWSFVSDRASGVHLANALLEAAHFQPVGVTSKVSFKRGREFENATTFLDDNDALYRFVSTFTTFFLKGQSHGRYHDFWPKFSNFNI